ncbi:hypothetical protein ElyMa_006040300 [Elysia marginata]|uniref:Uncharacterized protein n=1 Tax=Elysia marginata TaxID=1093978 RepID=A0AAV4GKR4_9GAST|nr:hypothetical protein ElyMa_006040300 [Elysia marginata]
MICPVRALDDVGCPPQEKPQELQERKNSDLQRSSPALLNLEPVINQNTPVMMSRNISDEKHPTSPRDLCKEVVTTPASLTPQNLDIMENHQHNQQPRRPRLPQQNLSLTSPVSTTTPASPSSRTFSSPGYSDEPMSAGQRRAHWRYFNANSHPQSSNCDNNLSMTSDVGMGVGGGRGGHLYRHASYPLTGQHLMTCINIDSPDDNNANLSPPPSLYNSSGTPINNNNNINSNNYLDNISTGNRHNNNIDTSIETHPRLSTRSFDPHFEGEEDENEVEEEDNTVGNSNDQEDKSGSRESFDKTVTDWPLMKKGENLLNTSSYSPTDILDREKSDDKSKPEEGQEFGVTEGGDRGSHKGSSTSGLSSLPSSSGSLSEPHLLKSSPSSDLVVHGKSQSLLQGEVESRGPQVVGEDTSTQFQGLHKTAEAVPGDSGSCGDQDPLSPFSPAVSSDDNGDTPQRSYQLGQQQEHPSQGIRFNFETEREAVKSNEKTDFHPFSNTAK